MAANRIYSRRDGEGVCPHGAKPKNASFPDGDHIDAFPDVITRVIHRDAMIRIYSNRAIR